MGKNMIDITDLTASQRESKVRIRKPETFRLLFFEDKKTNHELIEKML